MLHFSSHTSLFIFSYTTNSNSCFIAKNLISYTFDQSFISISLFCLNNTINSPNFTMNPFLPCGIVKFLRPTKQKLKYRQIIALNTWYIFLMPPAAPNILSHAQTSGSIIIPCICVKFAFYPLTLRLAYGQVPKVCI